MNEGVEDIYRIMLSGGYQVSKIEFKRSVPHIYYESWPLARGYKFQGLTIVQYSGIERLPINLSVWQESWWEFLKRRMWSYWSRLWNRQ